MSTLRYRRSFSGANTLRPRWYLVQIRLDSDEQSQANQYFVDFFRKHPTDGPKKDDKARFWPDWYEIIWADKEKSCWDYGRPILVQPNRKPCTTKHSRFSDTVEFGEETRILVGPFDFAPKATGTAANQFVPPTIWAQLATACHECGLVPPDLSFDPATCTNTVFICRNSHSVPWYHSSLVFSEVVRRSLP